MFIIDIYNKKCIMKNNMKEEQEEKENAISKFVENSILPIIADYFDKKTGKRKVGVHGTGTLFKFLDKYFLITAAHVLRATEGYEDYVGIPVGMNSIEVIKFRDCISYCPEDELLGNIYDIGIIELSDKLGKILEKSYQFLNEQNIRFSIQRNMDIYVSGYPCDWGIFDKTRNILITRTFRFMSKYKISKKKYDEFDPKAHILVEYNKIYYVGGKVDKLVFAEQNLNGISGCSLWSYENIESNVWSAEKCLKVIGIQSGVMKEEYIKGTKWEYMIEIFRHIDKNIFDLLSECNKEQTAVRDVQIAVPKPMKRLSYGK